MSPAKEDATQIAESHLEMEKRIQLRAHEIWKARGCQAGQELENWLEAEREIVGGGQKDSPQDRATVVGSAKKPRTVFR